MAGTGDVQTACCEIPVNYMVRINNWGFGLVLPLEGSTLLLNSQDVSKIILLVLCHSNASLLFVISYP